MARRKSIALPMHMLSNGELVNQRQGQEGIVVLVKTDKMASPME